MCCQEGSRANRSAQPGKEKARMMTVTSGRKCCAALTKSGRLGSLVKMLLESPRWYNPRVLLTWKIKPLYSRRIIDYISTDALGSLPLKKSVQILNRYNTTFSRLLFQLAPLERPIAGIGYLSSEDNGMLPTPTAWDGVGGGARPIKDGRTAYKHKYSARLKDKAAAKLLPTPLARDYKGGTTAIRKDTGTVRYALDSLVKLMENAGEHSRLSPLFIEEMMGFPSMWTALPYLSESGVQNPLKPMATQ